MNTVYQAGFENGKLVRELDPTGSMPSDLEWSQAACGDAEEASISEFIRGCKDGWNRVQEPLSDSLHPDGF